MFKFSMQNQQWSTMTSPFNAPIFQNDGYAFNGKIYTYVNHVFNDLNDTGLYEYTPSTNTWVKLLDGTQLTLQSNHSLVGSSDRIFFPNTQRVYDIATNSLMSLTGTPFNQTSATAYNQSKFVRVQDRVYSVGSATVITANYTEVNTIQVLDTTRYKRWGSAGNHGSSVSGLEDSRFTITNTGVLKGVGTNGHFTIDSVTNAFTLTPYASGSGAANQGSITRDGTIYYLVTDGISGATNKQRALYRYNPVLGTSTRLVGIDNAYLYNGQQVNSSASDCILFVTHDNYVVVWDNNIASHGPASSYHVYNIATSTMSRQTKPIISAGSYMRINDNASVMFCYGTYGVSDDGFHIYLTAQSLMRFVGGTAVPIPSDSIMQNGTVLIALSMTDVYVNAIGGVAYKQLKKYSLQSNSWSALPDLPENILNNPNDMIQSISGTKASTGFYGVVRHSGPYLNGANYIEQIVKFNGTAWQRFSNKPVSPRMTGTLIDVGSKVYILGGESNTGDEPFYTQPAQTYDAYDLSSGSWKKSGDSAGYSGQMSATLDSQNYNFAPGEITTHTVILSGATSKTLQMTIPSGSQISVTTNASEWSSLAAPSIQRAEHMTAIGSDGKIYVFGGRDNNNNLTSGERYDPSANSWSSITPMTTERNFGRAVGDSNGNIYIIGGKNGANVPIDTVLKYSIASNSYTTVANLPVALTHIAVAIDSNNNIYVVGGLNASNSDVNTVYKYNPVVNEWTTIANMSVTRSLAGAAVIEGFLYIYGGGNANNAYLSSGEKLNLANSNFSPMASDVGVRNHTFVLDKQGRLYVIGGSTSSEGVSNKVRIYDTFSNTWSSGTNMTTGVFSTYGVSDSNGVICIVGGYSAVSTTSSLVQKYTPNNSFSFSNTNGTRSGNGFDVTGNLTSPGTYGTQSRRAGWRNGISVNPGDNISITIPTGGAVRIIWGSGKSFPDNAVV